MNQKKFGIDEAVQFVLEPGSEPELSELGESDFEENNDITTEVLPWIRKLNLKEEKEREVIINNEQNSVPLESENECKKVVKNRKYEYCWRSTNPPEEITLHLWAKYLACPQMM